MIKEKKELDQYRVSIVYSSYELGMGRLDYVNGDFESARKHFENALEAAGSSLDQVVKTTVFLADMKEFSGMNEVYATFFSGALPARATVAAAGLPRDARVEIEAVALVSE